MRNNNWQAELAAYEWNTCFVQFLNYLNSQRQLRLAKANHQRRAMNEQTALKAPWEWWNPRR